MSDGKGLLLIIEDHEPTRRILASILGREGWTVLAAATLEDGIRQLDRGPACIVLDLVLPDGHGGAVLEHIRRSGRPIRVVVTTVGGAEAHLGSVAALRPDALIQKPIEVNELLRACEGSAQDETLPPPAGVG